MKSRFTGDPLDPSDSLFSDAGDGLFTPYLPPAWTTGGNGSANAPVVVSPTPTLPSEAAEAEGAQSGPATVVAETSGGSGITINLLFDAAAMAAPASFRAGIEQAASILAATITNQITVNIKIDYSGTGGGAAAGPDGGLYENYSTVRTDLINDAAPGDTTFNSLPTGSTIQGQSQVAVWNAQLKLFGLLPANSTTTDDGSATFATDINPNLLVGVALHELTHALGRVPYGQPDAAQPDIFDFYRFTSAGTRLFTDNIPASAAYFSLNGGNTKIADYGQDSDPSDFLNSPGSSLTPNDAFNEYYNNSTSQTLSTIDKEQLDALGFNTITKSIAVPAAAFEAVQGGSAVALLSGTPTITDSASTTLTSATIKIANAGGSAVTGDNVYVNGVQNGSVGNGVTASWNAAADTLMLTGSASLAVYDTLLSEVSYQDAGADSSTGSHPVRTVTWTVNDGTVGFGTTSQIEIDRAPVASVANVVLNSNSSPVAASSLFSASDSDGDAIATYAFMDTGNGHFVLNGAAQANNQEIDVTAAQLSQLSYQSTGGVDSLEVRVNDGTTWSAWQGFTVAGPVATVVIHTDGSTSLVEIGNDYYLENTGTGAGPEMKYLAAPITVGEWGAWEPIGAVQTATGYMAAWELPGANSAANQYTVWNIDTNGNDTTNTIGTVSGTSTALESLETIFGQDLNGDGVIGIPATVTVVQTDGSTSLVQTGNDYFVENTGTGTGPELKFQGAPITAGEWGGWEPIGAVATATGYMVAWELPGATPSANQYTVWNIDTNGNDTINTVGTVSGNSPVLESLESTFHQDLNGDGVIGLPAGTAVIESFGSTSLVQVGNDYYLENNTTGIGPELKYQGAPIVANEWTGWAPIGAEATATGYEVAWKVTGADQYTVWNTDSNGNDSINTIGTVSGSSTALESLEPSFQQDLNGDGAIGIPAATGPGSGTAPVTVANNDTFVFGSGGSAGGAADSAGATGMHLGAFSSAAANLFAALFHDAPPAQSPAQFHWASDGHDTTTNPGNHESIAQMNAHFADLHAAFLIH
jgi:serralysin